MHFTSETPKEWDLISSAMTTEGPGPDGQLCTLATAAVATERPCSPVQRHAPAPIHVRNIVLRRFCRAFVAALRYGTAAPLPAAQPALSRPQSPPRNHALTGCGEQTGGRAPLAAASLCSRPVPAASLGNSVRSPVQLSKSSVPRSPIALQCPASPSAGLGGARLCAAPALSALCPSPHLPSVRSMWGRSQRAAGSAGGTQTLPKHPAHPNTLHALVPRVCRVCAHQ